MPDDSDNAALEHFVWARSQGISNDEILAFIGVRVPLAPSDRLVLDLLAAAHRLLDRRLAA